MSGKGRGKLGFFGKGVHALAPSNTGTGDFGFDGAGTHSTNRGTGTGDFGFEGLGQPVVHASNTGTGDFGFGGSGSSTSASDYAWTISIENVDVGDDGEFPTLTFQISQAPPFAATPDWLTIDNLEGRVRAKGWGSYIGKGGELDDVAPGTGSIILDNLDGVFDPDNASSPIAALLTTGRRIRVTATFAGVTTVVFDQYVDFWPQNDDPTVPWREVTVSTLDVLSQLANRTFMPAKPFTPDDDVLGVLDADNLISGVPYFAGASTGERIAQILELLGWPAELVDIDPGYSQLIADYPTDKVLPVLQQITRSEPGLVYATAAGRLRFLQRNTQPSNPPIVFSDNPDVQAGEPYDSIDIDRSKALIKNRVTRTAGARTYTLDDADSQTLNGVVEDSKTDLLNASLLDLIAMCEYEIARYSGAVARITALTIDATDDPAVLFPFVIAVDLGWQLTAGRTPQLGGPITLRDCVVESIATTVTAPRSWTVVLGLVEADPNQYFTPDDALLGVLDADNVYAF